MEITQRDIELMRWIQEQKFMSGKQIRKVFWKNISENSREDYKRLRELQMAGFLKKNKRHIYRNALYLVTSNGMRPLKASERYQGWSELADVDYSTYCHDLAVTDLRILFHQMGYQAWISERVLSRWKMFRNVADGMIHHNGGYYAIEYESSQKAKDRYKEIFLNYAFDSQVNAIIYVLDVAELITRVSRESATCKKLYFATFQELQEQQLETQLRGNGGLCSLKNLLDGLLESREQAPRQDQLVGA